jgi:hypothetical protein
MSTSSLVFCGLLALTMGFLAQQTMESLINSALVLVPFNIRTVK